MYPEGRFNYMDDLADPRPRCDKSRLLVYPEERSKCTRKDETAIVGAPRYSYPEERPRCTRKNEL